MVVPASWASNSCGYGGSLNLGLAIHTISRMSANYGAPHKANFYSCYFVRHTALSTSICPLLSAVLFNRWYAEGHLVTREIIWEI
jgi:hypothetical protein